MQAPTTSTSEIESFCKRLPKIELHAHLSGSIRRHVLHRIWFQRKLKNPEIEIDDPLSVIPAQGVRDIKHFFPLFSRYIYELVNNVEAVAFTTRSVLDDFANDGVAYLELRTTPRSNRDSGMTKEDQIETILATIVKYEQEDLTTMKTTLILSIDRRDSPEDAMRTVELAIRYKKLGVVGVDLCGDPFKGDIYTFRHPFAKAKEAGLGLTIHFAEASLTSSDEELLTLLSYQPDRLGHCIHASDIVKREIIRRKITLELCISCNVQIRLDPKVAHHHDHHFGEWWKSKACPIALCTDDVGIFNTSCSHEFYLVAKHFELTEKELWELGYNAIDSIFGPQEKKERLKELFIGWKEIEGLL